MTHPWIGDGSRVLLDTITLIYFLERHPRYGATAQHIFQRIETGAITALVSSLIFAELLVPLYRNGDIQTARSLQSRLQNFRHLTVLDLTTDISAQATRLRAQYGLRTPDAIHGATALASGANGILGWALNRDETEPPTTGRHHAGISEIYSWNTQRRQHPGGVPRLGAVGLCYWRVPLVCRMRPARATPISNSPSSNARSTADSAGIAMGGMTLSAATIKPLLDPRLESRDAETSR